MTEVSGQTPPLACFQPRNSHCEAAEVRRTVFLANCCFGYSASMDLAAYKVGLGGALAKFGGALVAQRTGHSSVDW